jgi:hypothetical protein
MNLFRLSALLLAFAVVPCFAKETNSLPSLVTVGTVTYSNITWGTVTPATVTIIHSTGVAAIPLESLPPKLQKRFGYDAKKAAEYRFAEQQAEAVHQEALQKQRTEAEAVQLEQAKQALKAKELEAAKAPAPPPVQPDPPAQIQNNQPPPPIRTVIY